MDPTTIEDVVVLKVTTSRIQEDVKELKEQQKAVLDFIAEQKTGRKFVWLFLGIIASLVAVVKDFGAIFSSYFHK